MSSSSFSAHGQGNAAEPHAPPMRARARRPASIISPGLGLFLFFAWLTLTADPLEQWYRRNPLPTADRLDGVTFGNNTFVAVGFGGTVASSTDGTNWVSVN